MPDTNYIFSKSTLHFFSHDDIYTMYQNGMTIKQISRRLSRVLGLKISAVTPIVNLAIYERVCPPAPPLPPSPFPQSWAVGDFMCRRY